MRRSSSKPPPSLVFFTDRDLGPTETCDVVRRLRDCGLTVEPHDSHFEDPENIPDEAWLRYCAERDWIALSKDTRIRHTELSLHTIMANQGRLFVCIGQRSHPQLAANICHSAHNIERFVSRHAPPFIARLYMASDADFERGKPGQVSMWLTYDQYLEGRADRG